MKFNNKAFLIAACATLGLMACFAVLDASAGWLKKTCQNCNRPAEKAAPAVATVKHVAENAAEKVVKVATVEAEKGIGAAAIDTSQLRIPDNLSETPVTLQLDVPKTSLAEKTQTAELLVRKQAAEYRPRIVYQQPRVNCVCAPPAQARGRGLFGRR